MAMERNEILSSNPHPHAEPNPTTPNPQNERLPNECPPNENSPYKHHPPNGNLPNKEPPNTDHQTEAHRTKTPHTHYGKLPDKDMPNEPPLPNDNLVNEHCRMNPHLTKTRQMKNPYQPHAHCGGTHANHTPAAAGHDLNQQLHKPSRNPLKGKLLTKDLPSEALLNEKPLQTAHLLWRVCGSIQGILLNPQPHNPHQPPHPKELPSRGLLSEYHDPAE
ncbi:hypothetical protein BS47DRAFT_1369574 [Hydnum rufescens UP504]|uniref:Uncharacterized protein n=1 Tax=Hydnum rufescens UP504 TaxID=1448309 RepID=A0A9P6DMB4_9AGAM|nr:hypothetical protein BS47DRAFT_1369574 [Hydnum rufescens UP504]